MEKHKDALCVFKHLCQISRNYFMNECFHNISTRMNGKKNFDCILCISKLMDSNFNILKTCILSNFIFVVTIVGVWILTICMYTCVMTFSNTSQTRGIRVTCRRLGSLVVNARSSGRYYPNMRTSTRFGGDQFLFTCCHSDVVYVLS